MHTISSDDFLRSLDRCSLLGFDEHYSGKVRECFVSGSTRLLVATDRLSCFDRIISTIPFKGQVLTSLSRFWFERIRGQIPSHFIELIDPCVMAVKSAQVIPFEVVVRGYLAGSAWRAYRSGITVPGLELAPGLTEFDELPEPMITPSTKAAIGAHDTPISVEDIHRSGMVRDAEWRSICAMALELFAEGQRHAKAQGLLLADTKYEFGRVGDTILLIDEVHTLDSSRYWESSSYEACRKEGRPPIMIDKEPVRRWLLERGYQGEGYPPALPDAERLSIASHYVTAHHRILGEEFTPERSDPLPRIVRSLGNAGYRCSVET
jgi:phosphoribosylaminoimidazole-succinocarboxamide synthase